MEGQFLHSLPVLNHPTWEWKRGAGREGGRGQEKAGFFPSQKNFYRSICLIVLTARVVSECIDVGKPSFRGHVLYCFRPGQ